MHRSLHCNNISLRQSTTWPSRPGRHRFLDTVPAVVVLSPFLQSKYWNLQKLSSERISLFGSDTKVLLSRPSIPSQLIKEMPSGCDLSCHNNWMHLLKPRPLDASVAWTDLWSVCCPSLRLLLYSLVGYTAPLGCNPFHTTFQLPGAQRPIC